mgnify:CR=1 FL=1
MFRIIGGFLLCLAVAVAVRYRIRLKESGLEAMEFLTQDLKEPYGLQLLTGMLGALVLGLVMLFGLIQ